MKEHGELEQDNHTGLVKKIVKIGSTIAIPFAILPTLYFGALNFFTAMNTIGHLGCGGSMQTLSKMDKAKKYSWQYYPGRIIGKTFYDVTGSKLGDECSFVYIMIDKEYNIISVDPPVEINFKVLK